MGIKILKDDSDEIVVFDVYDEDDFVDSKASLEEALTVAVDLANDYRLPNINIDVESFS